MKLLYASDYDGQKDIPLSFYDLQRKKFHNGEKDDTYIKEHNIIFKNGTYRIYIQKINFQKGKVIK